MLIGLEKLEPESKMSVLPRREPITLRKRKDHLKSYILIQVMDALCRFKLEETYSIRYFRYDSVLTRKMCLEMTKR